MSKRPRGYLTDYRPQPATQAIIGVANGLIVSERVVTPRRVLYVCIERGLTNTKGKPLDKSKTSYGTVIDALVMARRAGLIRWSDIADTTEREDPDFYEDPADFRIYLSRLADSYRLDRQLGQETRLVVWSEHRGLKRILAPACREYGIPLVLSGGADSVSGRKTMADRAGDWREPTEILHIGDRDRAGEDIFSVLEEDLPLLSYGSIEKVTRLALTGEQAVQYGLARSPYESVQVDALAAPDLAGLLQDAITSRIDRRAFQALLDREAAERTELIRSLA